MSDQKLADLRQQIDEIDQQCLALITKRLTIAQQIAGLKADVGKPHFSALREHLKIRQDSAALTPNGDTQTAQELLQLLINSSRNQQPQAQHKASTVWFFPADSRTAACAAEDFIARKALPISALPSTALATLLATVGDQDDHLAILPLDANTLTAIHNNTVTIQDCWLQQDATGMPTLIACVART